MSNWYEITVATTSEGADLIADAFFSEGCQGVSIKDKNDLLELYRSDIIWDYIDEKAIESYDDFVYVKGVFGATDLSAQLKSIEERLNALKENSSLNFGAAELIAEPLVDTDWRSEWKKYYKPIVTKSVTVVPKWIKYQAASAEKLLYINPGMAFGTGEHETTKMCLDLLGELDVTGKKVIDVGAGSGILGIAAALLGADGVYMCDIDSAAVETAAINIKLNKVAKKCVVEQADLLAKNTARADIMFANITADILIRLSKGLINYIAKGGNIILSGIIDGRLDEVIAAYESLGLTVEKKILLGDWHALLLRA